MQTKLVLLILATGLRLSAQKQQIEQRIDSVISNLKMETSIKDSFVSRTLDQQLAFYHTPGISIAVINNGKLEWARGFGYANTAERRKVDTNTLFQAGSVSKPTTATAIMKLYEQGKISLDTNVNNYLTSWKIPPTGNWQPIISLRQILSHTAGLTVHGFPGYQRSEKIPTTVQILNGEPPANTPAVFADLLPGTRSRYSGGGTVVAQLVLTDHFKSGFPELVQSALFAPLHMNNSSYAQPLPPSRQKFAATAYPNKGVELKGGYHIYPEMAPAGLWTTPSDLAKMTIELQNALKGESTFFKKETIEEMFRPQPCASYVGIGFFLDGDSANGTFGHGGWDEGFVTKLTAFKNKGQGAIVMLNSNEGWPLLDEVVNSIAKVYHWPGFEKKAPTYLQPSKAEADSIVGNYTASNGLQIMISHRNNQLWMELPGQNPVPLLKSDKDFVHPQMRFKLQFKPNELALDEDGQSTTFTKTSDQKK